MVPPPPETSLDVEGGAEGFPVLWVGVFVGETVFGSEPLEVVVEMETTGGAVGVASGSLPAAFASVTSNEPLCTESVRHMKDLLVEGAYGPIRIRPMRYRSVERDIEGVSTRNGKSPNWDK